MQRAALLALLLSAPAHADFFNNRNVIPGERAASLGGAYTALSDDVSGAFYNPAGLGFVEEHAISLSGTAYEVEINNRAETFDGATVPMNVRLNRFNTIPTTAGITLVTNKKVVIALTAFEGDRIFLSAIGSASDLPIVVQFPSGAKEPYSDAVLRVRIDNDTVLAGPSLGYRFDDHWSFGATVFLHYFQGSLGIANDFTNGAGDQAISQEENSVWSAGLIPILGAQWRGEKLRLGFSYWMETLHLAGENAWTVSLVSTHGSSFLDTGTDVGDVRYPHRLAFGAAWHDPGRFLLSLDVIAYLPMDYPAPHEMLRTDVADNHHQEVFHLDAALGFERWLDPRWSLRFGLYTNSSGASAQYAPERVNQYGVTLGFGYVSSGLVSGGGVRFEYGRSPPQRDPTAGSEVSWERFHFGVTYGGTHRFLGG